MELRRHKECAKIIKRLEKRFMSLTKTDNSYQLPLYFLKLKSILDDDFHSVIKDEQFEKLGNIYYV